MKQLLVSIDFSMASRNAYTYALKLAETLDANINLLYIYEGQDKVKSIPKRLGESLVSQEKEQALHALTNYGEAIQEELGIQIPHSYVIKQGNPAEKIIAHAEKMNAELIIMSTRSAKGASGIIHTWIGNTSTKVLEKTTIPVLLVPEEAVFDGLEHIVYATNFREKEQRIPRELIQMSDTYDQDISVVHVHRSGSFYGPIEFEFLNEMYHIEKDNVNIFFYTIHHENIIQGLNTFIRKEKGDMLAMLVHDRLTIFDRLMGPDVPRQMAFHSHVPLLILHQDSERI